MVMKSKGVNRILTFCVGELAFWQAPSPAAFNTQRVQYLVTSRLSNNRPKKTQHVKTYFYFVIERFQRSTAEISGTSPLRVFYLLAQFGVSANCN